ncbi:MAG: BTAD domain-containing putative transcriptional regulator [Gammaproteobacteria bacterium]
MRIYTLGRFSVTVHRHSLNPQLKPRYQRPWELLQALIAFGGRDVHAELLSQALWPDADGDHAQNTFDVTLHRLRRLFNVEALFLMRGRRLSLNHELAWVDVWSFERLINHAARLIPRFDDPGTAHQLARYEERLLNLYQGAFLEREATRPWALSLRERLRSKLLRHMHEAGPAWERAGEWETAIRCYQKGLEIDPLFESLYQRLMYCFRETGRVPEALATYHRCRTVLAQQFQIEPSRNTRQLYNSLIT